MKFSFEEFCKHITVKNYDGTISPLILTKSQKDYVEFISWIDEHGYDKAIFLHMRNSLGKSYFRKLYKEYISQKS